MKIEYNNEKPERELILHHLDQVLAAYKETNQTNNRVLLLLFFFSIIAITLSTGIVSINQKISIFGLILSIPTWLILFSCAYLVGLLFTYFMHLNLCAKRQINNIKRLYNLAGYQDKFLLYRRDLTLGGSTIAILINNIMLKFGNLNTIGFINGIIGLLTIVILMLFPLIAECITFYKMLILFGWEWWVIATFLLLLFITVVSSLNIYVDESIS